MPRVGIIGAETLLGKHLRYAVERETDWEISSWNPRPIDVEENNNMLREGCVTFSGVSSLEAAVAGCDTVFCLYELQDMSAAPVLGDLILANSLFVLELMQHCQRASVERFVLLSSYYVQCSRVWPNLNSRELDSRLFDYDHPFHEYTASKVTAEIAVGLPSPMQRLIVRTGPLYGEGDLKSLICDSIKFCGLPRLSDGDGAIQFTYAGNVAYGLLAGVRHMKARESVTCDTVLMLDRTPIRNSQATLDDLLSVNEQSEYKQCMYLVFYGIYFLFLIILLPFRSKLATALPSCDWLHMMCYHWTYFNDMKMRTFVDYQPQFTYEDARSRSLDYYKSLNPDDVKYFSWESDFGDCFDFKELHGRKKNLLEC